MVDYGEPDRTPVDTSEGTRDSLGVIILAGIIAALLMVGAMLLLLQGVFEV